MLKLKSISPSRIKTFDMCKFKYWLTYHCPDVTLKSNWGAAHGSLVHDILENYSLGRDTDWVQRLYRGYGGTLETLDRHQKPTIFETPLVWAKSKDYADNKPRCDTCQYADRNNNKCSISLQDLSNLKGCPKQLFDTSISMIEETIQRYNKIWPKMLKSPTGDLIGCEYGFEIPIRGVPDVPMIGFMDLVVEESPDTVQVIDYKTGGWTQDYNECRNDIQVKMYSLACRRIFIDDVENKGYKYKNVILTFDYFTKSPITLAFTAEEDAQTELEVKRKVEEIQSTDFITRIVRNNDDFADRGAWKCRSLCDTEVCASKWKGRFKAS